MGNTFGKLFRLTTFGESHGKALGAILDGCPAGLTLDLEKIRAEMQRRKPGQSKITTQRKEEDEIELLSGVFEGKTTGTPIGILIPKPIAFEKASLAAKSGSQKFMSHHVASDSAFAMTIAHVRRSSNIGPYGAPPSEKSRLDIFSLIIKFYAACEPQP